MRGFYRYNDPEVGKNFIRGMVASGLVATTIGADRSRVIKTALQGGAAMAAGYAAADYSYQGRYLRSVFSVTAGFVGVAVLELFLSDKKQGG